MGGRQSNQDGRQDDGRANDNGPRRAPREKTGGKPESASKPKRR